MCDAEKSNWFAHQKVFDHDRTLRNSLDEGCLTFSQQGNQDSFVPNAAAQSGLIPEIVR